MGDTTLALTRELAGMDLAAIGRGGEEIVTSLPWGLLWYPQSLEIPLAISALVLATVPMWVVRRRYALTLPRVALSAVASVVVLVVAGVASYAVWRLALLIDPAQVSARGSRAVSARSLPVRDAARQFGCGPLVVRPGTSMAGCRRHARRRRSACRVHPARRLRVRRAADAGRGGRCGRRCAAS
jgi:hypothetical protein